MADGITMRGVEARIYWSYMLVGTVGAWTVTRSSPNDPGTVTASIRSVDSFRVSQRPLEFVVPFKRRELVDGTEILVDDAWRWPIAELQINGDGLTATLSRKE